MVHGRLELLVTGISAGLLASLEQAASFLTAQLRLSILTITSRSS
jgi:hypothetical protein